jgi:RNA polymerase sigma-70 factor (ECF subfamily)
MSATGRARTEARGGDTDEALAARSAAGDGEAFAELYERYERRAFNLCYRITGSHDDASDATQEAFLGVLRRLPALEGRDLAFGSYLFSSARNACYDLIERRRRAEPSEELPDEPPREPGDPGDDPDRNVLLEAQQEEIRAANAELPERQREALALRELEDLSYDEIAELMGMNRNSVAQLISRARISLREALRGTALRSIAPSSPDCERGLPLLAMMQDGQLDAASTEARWLGDHLAACGTCRLGREAMEEAGASYRAWVPIAAAPWLFRETLAQAAELVGSDWSEVIEAHERARRPRRGHGLRNALVAAALAAVLLLAGFAGSLRDGSPPPEPAAEEVPGAESRAAAKPKPRERAVKPKRGEPAVAPAPQPEVAVDAAEHAPAVTDEPSRGQAVERPRGEPEEGEQVTGVTPTIPEPPPPTDPAPEEPPPTDPPAEDPPPPSDPPRVCRDANGQPVPCPPPR